jgi:UDP:flavonoid glycosyltransferase YjiC (YdhE family)
MRVLLASTAGAGHYNPLVPFAEAVRRRGDDVLFVVPPGLADTVRAAGLDHRIGADPPAEELDAIWARWAVAPPEEAAVLGNRDIFGRLDTAAMLPAVDDTCRDWRPDVVLRDPCEFASAIVADRYGIDSAQVAISRADVELGSLRLAAPVLEPYSDGIVERIVATPYLSRFPASTDPSPYPITRRYRDVLAVPAAALPDWWPSDDRPLVYVTFGSVAGSVAGGVSIGVSIGVLACRAVLDAVADLPVRVLLTVGRAVDPAELGDIPANVHVEAWVPQSDVLACAAAVVCHGGSGTTFGTLAAGVPLVVVPLFADQPGNARCVAAAGAGVVVEPAPGAAATDRIGREHAPQIRAAVQAVLADPSYSRAAQRVADEMRDTPSVDELLSELR